MRDKIKALDRNVIVFVVIALLAFGSYALAGSGRSSENTEDTAVAQEAEVTEADEEIESDSADEAAPAEEQAESTDNTDSDSEGERDNNTTYDYTAQAGDSYSKIARKAVQTYGIINDVNLSQAQIIYAETKLTQEAGAPLLEVGEAVSINESAVANVLEAAGELDEAAETLWAEYVAGVDFNTDNIGEARE